MAVSFILRYSALLLALSTTALSSVAHWTNVEVVPAPEYVGLSQVNFTSGTYGLDSQHVHNINATAWEWYYFDAVSADGKSSIVIIMYTAPATGFAGGGPANDIIVASIAASLPGQETFFLNQTAGTSAVIASVDNGASGVWTGTGFSFLGASDLSQYTVAINSPQIGVKGTATFTSIAPAHYPCGPVQAGQNLEVMPHIG
jgi:hypothetical protein